MSILTAFFPAFYLAYYLPIIPTTCIMYISMYCFIIWDVRVYICICAREQKLFWTNICLLWMEILHAEPFLIFFFWIMSYKLLMTADLLILQKFCFFLTNKNKRIRSIRRMVCMSDQKLPKSLKKSIISINFYKH